jgi:hypothetical protein
MGLRSRQLLPHWLNVYRIVRQFQEHFFEFSNYVSLNQGFSLGDLVTRLNSLASHMVWQATQIEPGLEVNHHEIAH